MQEEVWRDIPGYEGLYAVSNLGNVKSLTRTRMYRGEPRPLYEKQLKPRVCPNGYLKVTLYRDGKPKQENIHRLVALAFLGPSQLQVNHKDEDKTNNCLDNLEYLTCCDNTRYSCSIPVESYDLNTGETIKIYDSISDTRQDGYNSGAVSSVCLNKYGYKSHHGVGWRYSHVGSSRNNLSSSRAYREP